LEKFELFLQVVAHVSNGFIDSTAGARRAAFIFDTERRRAPILESIVGLKFARVDLRTKSVTSARAAGAPEKAAAADIVAVFDVLLENRSGNSVVPVPQNVLRPLQLAEILGRVFARVGIGEREKYVIVEESHLGLRELENSL